MQLCNLDSMRRLDVPPAAGDQRPWTPGGGTRSYVLKYRGQLRRGMKGQRQTSAQAALTTSSRLRSIKKAQGLRSRLITHMARVSPVAYCSPRNPRTTVRRLRFPTVLQRTTMCTVPTHLGRSTSRQAVNPCPSTRTQGPERTTSG